LYLPVLILILKHGQISELK